MASLMHELRTPTRRLHDLRKIAASTALIIVDMQNGFIEPGGILTTPYGLGVIPNIQKLVTAVRGAGGTIAWTRHMWSDAHPRPDWFAAQIDPAIAKAMRDMLPGTHAHAIHDAFDVQDGDILIDKTRPTALASYSSDLHAKLQARGIDTIIVTGCVTSVCCQSTAREGAMLDYRVVFVPDANAGFDDETHEATLNDLWHMRWFDIRPAADIVADLEAR